MKIRIWDRLLSAAAGALIVIIAAGLFVYGVGVLPLKLDLSHFEAELVIWQRVLVVAIAVLLFLLGLHSVGLLFRRRKDKGFVIQQTEYGDMSISMRALENMVQKCVDAHHELKVHYTHISHCHNGVNVEIKITLLSGINIPLAVNALQKQIKQYITSCSGVDVQEVRVMVETDVARLQAPAEELVMTTFAEETVAVPERVTEQLCQYVEEPEAYGETTADGKLTETECGVQDETAEESDAQSEEIRLEAAEETETEKEQA